ncbi:hypothetical protein [Nocardioides sp. LML1-1-1.1]|uniref:hypothetical protein n=1 Tax=Nocardioides sp. LML1-1-1.1 TaxID=3135248 RepID=UPI0034137AA5
MSVTVHIPPQSSGAQSVVHAEATNFDVHNEHLHVRNAQKRTIAVYAPKQWHSATVENAETAQ